MPATKKKPANAPASALVAPPVFARILPRNAGGHVDDASDCHVVKRLKSWSPHSTDPSDARVTLEDAHGVAHYLFPTAVFGPEATNEEVYRGAAAPLLARFLDVDDPQSAFVFAYGQTGTGKTHTLMGPEVSWTEARHPEWGLFPRVVDEAARTMRSRAGTHEFALHVSAVEFYFCQGFDLLDEHAQVDVRDGEIVGRTQVEVHDAEDVLRVMEAVRANRTTASTKMNPALKAMGGKASDNKTHGGSSRSHCALQCTLRVVSRATRDVRCVSFTCMDLAGAERQSSNGNDSVGAMEAILSYWKDPAKVRPCDQAAIINVELSGLRSAVVQSAEAHRKGRPVAAPAQLGTAAVNFMTAAFDGRCHVANVVTLSQAPQCGWETWFACTYAEDVAKLRMPTHARKALTKNIGKLNMQSSAAAVSAKAALERTPPKGHPSSKFYMRRKIEAKHLAQEAKIIGELAAKMRDVEA